MIVRPVKINSEIILSACNSVWTVSSGLLNLMVAFKAKNTEMLLQIFIHIQRKLNIPEGNMSSKPWQIEPSEVESPVKRKNKRQALLKKLSLKLFFMRATKIKQIVANTMSVILVAGSLKVIPEKLTDTISKFYIPVLLLLICEAEVMQKSTKDTKINYQIEIICDSTDF